MDDCEDLKALSSSFFREKRFESLCIIGHKVVAIPSKVSTLLSGDATGASRGGNGVKQPAAGAVAIGAVPKERAVITS